MNREEADAVEHSEAKPTVASYRDLLVWKAAMDLAVACYDVTRSLPASEMYGLTSQIRRSASSISANIAEGYGREHRGSFVQFLRIAQGSLKELETHVILAGRLRFLRKDEVGQVLDQADELGRMLRAMIRSLQRKS